MKLLKFDMSKTANFFNLKFLAIMKILLPGRLFTIFVSLFPLFKLNIFITFSVNKFHINFKFLITHLIYKILPFLVIRSSNFESLKI